MIIHPIRRAETNDVTTLSVRVEYENPPSETTARFGYQLPDTLWFSFPTKFASKLTESHNGFLTALLPTAMYLGEDILVRGNVSKKLIYGIEEYQRNLHYWDSTFFKRIQITPAGYTENKKRKPSGALVTYSGGVDSTYTIWSHLPKNETNMDFHIKYLLHLSEYDTVKENVETRLIKQDSFEQFAHTFGATLITGKTNAHDFQEFGDNWNYLLAYGAELVGAAMFFEPIVSYYYFSTDYTHKCPNQFYTFNHVASPLLSTENLNVLVHGATVERYEKLRALGTWPEAYTRIVSCWERPNGLQNCGACSRCVQTMYFLKEEGLLDRFTTFPNKFSRKKIRRMNYSATFMWHNDSRIMYAKERRAWGMLFDYYCMKIRSYAISLRYEVAIFGLTLDDFLQHMLQLPNMPYRISHFLKQRSTFYSRTIAGIKSLTARYF